MEKVRKNIIINYLNEIKKNETDIYITNVYDWINFDLKSSSEDEINTNEIMYKILFPTFKVKIAQTNYDQLIKSQKKDLNEEDTINAYLHAYSKIWDKISNNILKYFIKNDSEFNINLTDKESQNTLFYLVDKYNLSETKETLMKNGAVGESFANQDYTKVMQQLKFNFLNPVKPEVDDNKNKLDIVKDIEIENHSIDNCLFFNTNTNLNQPSSLTTNKELDLLVVPETEKLISFPKFSKPKKVKYIKKQEILKADLQSTKVMKNIENRRKTSSLTSHENVSSGDSVTIKTQTNIDDINTVPSLNSKTNDESSIYNQEIKEEMKRFTASNSDDWIITEDSLYVKSYNNDTELMLAAAKGDLNRVILLIENGADVNEQNVFGNTALMSAVRNNQKEIVQQLLEAGADANIINAGQDTVLKIAIRNGYFDISNLLIKNGVIINEAELEKNIKLAIENKIDMKKIDTFLLQIEEKKDLNLNRELINKTEDLKKQLKYNNNFTNYIKECNEEYALKQDHIVFINKDISFWNNQNQKLITKIRNLRDDIWQLEKRKISKFKNFVKWVFTGFKTDLNQEYQKAIVKKKNEITELNIIKINNEQKLNSLNLEINSLTIDVKKINDDSSLQKQNIHNKSFCKKSIVEKVVLNYGW